MPPPTTLDLDTTGFLPRDLRRLAAQLDAAGDSERAALARREADRRQYTSPERDRPAPPALAAV